MFIKNALPTRREAHFSLFFRACLTGSKQHIVNRYHLPDICRYLIGKVVAEQHIPVGAESCQTYILPIEPQAFFLALVGEMISLIHISVKLKNALGRKSVSSSDIKRTVPFYHLTHCIHGLTGRLVKSAAVLKAVCRDIKIKAWQGVIKLPCTAESTPHILPENRLSP